MKKYTTLAIIALAMIWSVTIMAQTPQLLNYQGIARNGSGQPLANQALGLRITIQDGANTALYTETQNVTTNAYGLYVVQIGAGTAVTGTMNSINWLSGARYAQVEMDPAGGTAYVAVGSPTQLASVPYAMGANSVQATSGGGAGLIGTGANSLWWGFYEGGVYRGYLGSYSGKNEDVDFGTGGGNTTGSVNLVIAATPKLTVDSIGNVGIGTRFPGYRLRVDGVTGGFADNGIRIQNTSTNTGWNFYASSTGNLIIGGTGNLGQFDGTTGAYTALSDERLKTNILSLESVLPRLMALDPKRYEFINNNPTHKQSIGFIAQQVQKSFPEYVTVNKTNEGNPFTTEQLGLDYAGMSVVAVKAIQEQQAIIQKMQKQIDEMQSKLNALTK